MTTKERIVKMIERDIRKAIEQTKGKNATATYTRAMEITGYSHKKCIDLVKKYK